MQQVSRKERERLAGRILSEMGRVTAEALLDPDTVELMLNSDGKVWVEKQGRKAEHIADMSHVDAITLFNTIADSLGEVVNSKSPILEGKLIVNGGRFEGCIPPIVDAPIFAIRNKARKVYTLDEYVLDGTLTERQVEALREGIRRNRNILVVGSTGSGKTTLTNAILAEIGIMHPDDRLVTMEDTPELQVSVQNHVSLYTSINASMRDLLKATMRLRPDKIVVGETRGAEALDLLKAWNTGHSGGVSTVHANSALAGLTRLEELCAEATERPTQNLIAEAVNISLFIERTPQGRKVTEMLAVSGYDHTKKQYTTTPL